MSLETIRDFLGWCTVINWILLLCWWLFMSVGRGWVYRVHTQWFRISEESFDTTHYRGMAYFKMAIFMFNLAPYLALRIVG